MRVSVSSAASRGRPSQTRLRVRAERAKLTKRMALLYVFLVVPVVVLFIFHYIPIYGIVIAFKDFKINKGILRSPWNNFEHFRMLFANMYFGRIMRNTLLISAYRIIFEFPAPIILALLLNEIGSMAVKRTIQTVSYLPHFMSWVVLSGIIVEVLSPQRGIVGYVYRLLGRDAPNLLMSTRLFRPLLIMTAVWKEVGWGTVIYLAAISSVNPELYESASIDGANRLRKAMAITLPSIIPVITILFILRIGSILNAGFDQIFNLANPIVYEVGDIIDTYSYRVGLIELRYEFSTAVGLFKNAIGIILLLLTNLIVKSYSDYGLW